MTDADVACVKAIVAHEEHDTVYVKDPACRSFSYDTLKLFTEIILENMPAGAALPVAHLCLLLACMLFSPASI